MLLIDTSYGLLIRLCGRTETSFLVFLTRACPFPKAFQLILLNNPSGSPWLLLMHRWFDIFMGFTKI